jgi:hypothetical protein
MSHSRYRDVSELTQALVCRDIEVNEDVAHVAIQIDLPLLEEVSYRIATRTTRSLSSVHPNGGLRGLLHPSRLIEDARLRGERHRPLVLSPSYDLEVRRMRRKIMVRSFEDPRFVLGPWDLSQGDPELRRPEDGVIFDLARLALNPQRAMHEFSELEEAMTCQTRTIPPVHVFGRPERRAWEPMLRLGSLRVCDLDRVTLQFSQRPPELIAMSLETTHDPFRPLVNYLIARR